MVVALKISSSPVSPLSSSVWTEPCPDERCLKNNPRATRKAAMSERLGIPRARSVEQYWISGPEEEGRMSISRTVGGEGWRCVRRVLYELRA